MSDACPLIGRQGKRFFQIPAGTVLAIERDQVTRGINP
jgi:hypothetical protein